jgi:hypothetical protein
MRYAIIFITIVHLAMTLGANSVNSQITINLPSITKIKKPIGVQARLNEMPPAGNSTIHAQFTFSGYLEDLQ